MEHFRKLTSRVETLLDHPYAPPICVILSDVFFTWMDASVQHLEKAYLIGSGQIVFIRMGITIPLALLYLSYAKSTPLVEQFKSQPYIAWIRGVGNVLGLSCAYAAFEYIQLSEAVVVFHLKPFPAALLCYLFLGEVFTRYQLAACVISFGGVILVFQPTFLFSSNGTVENEDNSEYWKRMTGFLLMGCGMLLAAIDVLLVRKIGKSVDTITLITIYAMVSLFVAPLWILIEGTPIIFDLPIVAWVELILVGVAGFGGQLAITLALQRELGGKVALLGYLQVPVAILVQYIVVRSYPNLLGLGGMSIIIAAGIWAAVYSPAEGDHEGREEEYVPLAEVEGTSES